MRVVDRDEWEGTRILEGQRGLASHDIFDAGDGAMSPGASESVGNAFRPSVASLARRPLHALDGAVVADPIPRRPLLGGAVVDANN